MSATPTGQLESPSDSGLARLESALSHRFVNRALLLEALTHTSYAHEFPGPGIVANERLEFLGDAVLGLIASDVLYRRFPTSSEGELTNLRAALVRASTLAAFARRIELGSYVRLGRGEEATGGRERELLLARTCEAIVGALYQDGGMDAARAFLATRLEAEITRVTAGERIKDDKSLLQEL